MSKTWNLINMSIACKALLITTLLFGCAAQKLGAPPAEGLLLDAAVERAVDDIFLQTQGRPGVLARIEGKLSKKRLLVDPLLDAASGQQTEVMHAVEQKIGERVHSDYSQWEILPFRPSNVSQAHYLMAGTLTHEEAVPHRKLRLNLSLTELKTGVVVAQTSVLVIEEGLDANPTQYYRDSPVIVRDGSTDAYARTAAMPSGQKADPEYIERVVTAALISEATSAYNSARYDEALNLYTNAAASPGGEQLRVFNGLYLANWKLGRSDDSEKAFGRIVAYGLANNALGVKILFRPGSTEFWPDPKVSGPYSIWLRQIAREASASKVCLNLVGHTSRTGPEEVNVRLSQQRASYIKQRLEAESPVLSARTRFTGVGWRENLVGIGSDDARDALDRRVEFNVINCTTG
jgi:outer membrane protein OmpA-like peptidoglycan-associated protein